MLDLRRRGVTLMLTTHDMLEADRLCDRIAIVDHGRIIALDTPRGLRRLLPAERGLEIAVTGPEPPALDGRAGVARVDGAAEDGVWRGRVYGEAEPVALVDALRSAGRELVELRRIEGTLEDVFVHLTGRELR